MDFLRVDDHPNQRREVRRRRASDANRPRPRDQAGQDWIAIRQDPSGLGVRDGGLTGAHTRAFDAYVAVVSAW